MNIAINQTEYFYKVIDESNYNYINNICNIQLSEDILRLKTKTNEPSDIESHFNNTLNNSDSTFDFQIKLISEYYNPKATKIAKIFADYLLEMYVQFIVHDGILKYDKSNPNNVVVEFHKDTPKEFFDILRKRDKEIQIEMYGEVEVENVYPK